MKKTVSLLLAILLLLCCGLPAAAQSENDVIALRLNSNVAGCTDADAERILEIRSGPVKYYEGNSCPISIANYAGETEYAHMDAGRTYTITYTLIAADGTVLPEELRDEDIVLDCGKGVSVVYCKIVELRNPNLNPAPGEPETTRVLRIMANVVVDGTPVQRLIGWLKDLILKIRAWSLF